MDNARISKIIYDEDSVRPMIIKFQNGALVLGKEEILSCDVFRNSENKNVAAISTDKMVYAGDISEDEYYNNFIMTVNRKAGESNLIAVNNVLLNSAPIRKRKSLNVSERDPNLFTELNKQFGSKRAKRHTEQYEKMRSDVGNIKEELAQTAVETHIDENDLVPQTTGNMESEYRPPINRGAQKVDQVYTLENLVPLAILSTVQNKVEEVLEGNTQIKLSSIVSKEILKLQQSSCNDKERKCQLLLYIDCLINMLAVPAKTISTSKYVPCTYSKEISTHIFNNFTTMSDRGRLRPVSMRDKCVCYILALTVLACNYEINLEYLAKDLKLGVKKLVDIARVMAFTITRDTNIATLKLPLPPPVTQGGSRKRRK